MFIVTKRGLLYVYTYQNNVVEKEILQRMRRPGITLDVECPGYDEFELQLLWEKTKTENTKRKAYG